MRLFDILYKHRDSAKTAIKDSDNEITYKQLYQKAINLGASLNLSDGISNVGIFIHNSVDYAIAYFAIAYSGHVIVPIDVDMPSDQLLGFIDFCDIKLILTNNKFYEDIVKKTLGHEIVILNISNDFIKSNNIIIHRESKENEAAVIISTSGTTNNPKNVMLSHRNIIFNAKLIIDNLQITSNDISLIVLPIRLSCNTSQFITHLLVGATIVFEEGPFDPQKICKIINSERVTNFSVVPAMLFLLSRFMRNHSNNMGSVKFITYSGCFSSEAIVRNLSTLLPDVKLIEAYGLTEAGPRISCIYPFEKKDHKGSVGKPMEGVECRIITNRGAEAIPNEIGELQVKGPSVMIGYYNNPSANFETFDGEWLKTGDICYKDQDGFLYIIGRKKNIINFGGNKVHPESIEKIISEIEGVSDVRVYGEKNQVLEEIPVAEIVQCCNDSSIRERIFNYCKLKLRSFERPQKIYIVNEIARTKSGKKLRNG